MTSITELKQTPGYTPSIVEIEATQSQEQEVVKQENEASPVVGESLTPQVSPVVPGEVLQVPASNLQPQDADTSALVGIAEALGGLLGGGTEEDPSAAGGAPTASVDIPEQQQIQLEALAYAPKGGGILSSIAPQSVQGISPVEKTPVQPTFENPRGYESVLPQMTRGTEPDSTKTTAVAPPETVQAVVDRYKSDPTSFSIDQSGITDLSSDIGSSWNFGTMSSPNALVIHHTAGGGNREGVIRTFKERNFPAHFIIERDGTIVQVLGLNQKGQHTKPAQDGSGITNSNSWGVEIIAKDDSDLKPAQIEAALKLAKFLETKGLDPRRIVGHGAINSHKQATEGKTVVQTIAQLGDF